MIHTEIEIAASPAHVKKVLLDFPRIPEWHSGLIKSITPLSGSEDLKKGSKLDCSMEGFHFVSNVTENTPELFQWQGPPIHTVRGLHSFRFHPSQVTPGWTTFMQDEEYTGLLAFVMLPSLGGKRIKQQFVGFNRDLKAQSESLTN